MPSAHITRQDFLRDRQGRALSPLLEDPELPFDVVLDFFNRRDHQHLMEDSETSHKKAPLAGVVRELEALPAVQTFLAASDPERRKRFEQSVTILVRMTMERLGWRVVPPVIVK